MSVGSNLSADNRDAGENVGRVRREEGQKVDGKEESEKEESGEV